MRMGLPDWRRLGWLHDLCPGFRSGKIWQIIVINPFIEFMTILLEYWAPVVPAGMTRRPAGHASGVVIIRAGHGPVLKCISAADVHGGPAVDHHMAPAMAFQATQRLLLTFFCIDFLVTDEEAIGQRVVGQLR